MGSRAKQRQQSSTDPMGVGKMRRTYTSHFANCANANQHRKEKTP